MGRDEMATHPVAEFLAALERALALADAAGAAKLFGPECYWRDLAALTWNIHTAEGQPAIAAMLSATLANAQPRGFTPDNAGLSPFMQRLARAHANCVESLPVFGGLLLVAIVTDRTSVTDSFAYLLLGSRIFQSLVHLASLSPTAVTVRFTAFAVQMAIAMYWAFMLLASA